MGPMGPQGPHEGRGRPPWAPWGPKGPRWGYGEAAPGRESPRGGVRPGGAPQPWADLCQRAKIRIRPRIFGRKKSRDLANLDPPRAPGGLPRHFCQKTRGRKLHTFDELWPIEIFPEKNGPKRPRLPMSTGTRAGGSERPLWRPDRRVSSGLLWHERTDGGCLVTSYGGPSGLKVGA